MRARPPLLAAVAAILVAAPAAAGAPVISGDDSDVWTAANPEPAYWITGKDGATVVWSVEGVGRGRGPSPLRVELGRIPDGRYVLEARRRGAPPDDIARRRFQVDTTPPAIAVREPRPGAVYRQGDVVRVDFSCTGAVRCTGSAADNALLPTGTPGLARFTVTAVDPNGNRAVARVDHTIEAPPPQVIRLAPPAPEPPIVRLPGTRDAERLSPPRATRVTTRRPLLSWRPSSGARLYNVQIYEVDGPDLRKVVSAFPTGARYRQTGNALQFGDRYTWRVWPYFASGYPKQPIGVSFFDVQRSVKLTPGQLLINQRISQAAVRRLAAIDAWLNGGIVTEDLRDGGLGREEFAAAGITFTGAGTAIPNGLAAPRPLQVAPARQGGTRAPVRVTRGQLLINQRISQSAVRRADALERRLTEGLSGGDIADGAIAASKLAPGLGVSRAAVVAAPVAPTRTAVAPPAARSGSSRVTAGQVLINQRISQAAVRRANALADLIGGGLTGANFQPGSIDAAKLAPELRR